MDSHDDGLTGRDPSQSAVAKLIAWSIANPVIVLMLAVTVGAAGWLAMQRTPLDAIPDLTDTQVIIRTDFPGQSPQIVEDLVTYPLSTNLLGLPRTKDVRGSSMFGTSFVYVIFEDDVDLYWGRARVVEALSRLGSDLPLAPHRRSAPTRLASAGSSSTRWSTEAARPTSPNCAHCRIGS